MTRLLSFTLLAAFLAGAPFRTRAESLLPPMNGAATDFAPRRAGAEVGAHVKITVSGEGLYRLDQPALVAAGVDPLVLAGGHLRLFCATQEVAIRVSNAGLWTASDYLVFFAKPFDGSDSDRHVYWLGWGGTGKRMAEKAVQPLPDVPEITSCDWTVHQRTYTFMQDKFLSEDDSFDHWFLQISQEQASTTIPITAPSAVPGEPAFMRMILVGHSTESGVAPDHRTRIKFNGVTQADYLFDGQTAVTNVCRLSNTALLPTNQVSFRQILRSGLAMDRVYVRALSLSYTRNLAVAEGALVFPGKAGAQNYLVRELTEEALWLLDVTDPDAPLFLTGFAVQPSSGTWRLRFGDEAGTAARYVVCQASKLRTVQNVETVAFGEWAATDWAVDYMVIAPEAFLGQAERLAQWRAAEGWAGVVVPLSDVYNEFGYGVADAAAIKQFLGYAYHHWARGPRYVVLAGSGTYDPRGYLLARRGAKAFKREERLPLHMGTSSTAWTALDGWFAQVDGPDKLPDFALGRLPATTSTALDGMINKIIAFESVPRRNWRRREALLVADRSDKSLNGKAVCESLRKTILFPGGYRCTTAYSDDLGEDPVRGIIEASFASGVSIVSYLGHGSPARWGRRFFDTAAVAALRNTHYPIVLMMACRNGALQSPLEGPCMSEALLNNGLGGASACIGTTSMSTGPSVEAFIHGFMRGAVGTALPRLGDGFLAGLADLNDYNPYTQELQYMNLFGDPAMVVNPP
jgi:hypothetical protein